MRLSIFYELEDCKRCKSDVIILLRSISLVDYSFSSSYLVDARLSLHDEQKSCSFFLLDANYVCYVHAIYPILLLFPWVVCCNYFNTLYICIRVSR